MFFRNEDGTFENKIVLWTDWHAMKQEGWRLDPMEWVEDIIVAGSEGDTYETDEGVSIKHRDNPRIALEMHALSEMNNISLNYAILSKARLIQFGNSVFGLNLDATDSKVNIRKVFASHLKQHGVYVPPFKGKRQKAIVKEHGNT